MVALILVGAACSGAMRTRAAALMPAFDPASIRAVSLDVTGTILAYTEPVHNT
jgi:hypothetical protein